MRRIYLGLLIFASLFLLSFRLNTVHAQDSSSGGGNSDNITNDYSGYDYSGSAVDWSAGAGQTNTDGGTCSNSGCGGANEIIGINEVDTNSSYVVNGYITDISVLGPDFASGSYYNESTQQIVTWGAVTYSGGGSGENNNNNEPTNNPGPPSAPPIAGYVIDQSGKPVSGAVVETAGVQATVGGDGRYSINGVVSFGQLYYVRVMSVPSGYDLNTRKPDGDHGNMGWTFIHYPPLNRDTDPQWESSYEFQVLGWDDCANATNDSRQIFGRCSFVVQKTIAPQVTVRLQVGAATGNAFRGAYGYSGQIPQGSGWINPMQITVSADKAGIVNEYYVAFYDKAGSEFTDKNSFLNSVQGRVNNPQNGFLVKYDVAQDAQYVWDNNGWIKLDSSTDVKNNSGQLMYAVSPGTTSSSSSVWKVSYSELFISKSFYTAVFVKDNLGRTGFAEDYVLKENDPGTAIPLQ